MDHRGQVGVMERLGKGSRHVLGPGFGKQKGLNEVSDWSQDVWDLNGIHALTAVPSQVELTILQLHQTTLDCGGSVSTCDSTKQIRGAFAW